MCWTSRWLRPPLLEVWTVRLLGNSTQEGKRLKDLRMKLWWDPLLLLRDSLVSQWESSMHFILAALLKPSACPFTCFHPPLMRWKSTSPCTSQEWVQSTASILVPTGEARPSEAETLAQSCEQKPGLAPVFAFDLHSWFGSHTPPAVLSHRNNLKDIYCPQAGHTV